MLGGCLHSIGRNPHFVTLIPQVLSDRDPLLVIGLVDLGMLLSAVRIAVGKEFTTSLIVMPGDTNSSMKSSQFALSNGTTIITWKEITNEERQRVVIIAVQVSKKRQLTFVVTHVYKWQVTVVEIFHYF